MSTPRKLAILLVLGFALSTVRTATAADIVNGWSAQGTITELYSLTSLTMFRVSGIADGCGHPSYWQLPLTDAVHSKTKTALLAAAFVAGKRIAVRCENSYVSDFQIFE